MYTAAARFWIILTQVVALPDSLLETKNPEKKASFFYVGGKNYVDVLLSAAFPVASPLPHWNF